MTDQRQVARWVAQYERRGWSYRRIGDEARVPESTVRHALRGKVTPRKPGPRARAKPAAKVVTDAYLQLGSIRATARGLRVSPTYVQARLFAAGLFDTHPDQRTRRSGTSR